MMSKSILYILLIVNSLQVNAQLLSDKELELQTPYKSLSKASQDSLNVIKLILKREKLKAIPDDIWSMKNLEYLDLSKNKIDSIPPQIKNLKNLQVLILSRNKIHELPDEFYQLKNLRILRIGSNEISYLSKQVRNFTKLEVLDLWNTNIGELPFELSKLKNLKLLDLRGILLNVEKQEDIIELYSEVKVLMSLPCNCSF
jgi:Leucine-rich repeat (LRR) protein